MKKLKVIGTPWHTGHQYEISKLSFIDKYDLVITNRSWATSQRPFPDKCSYIPYIPEDNDYDLAILHIDQQVVEPRINKGNVFFDLLMSTRQLEIPIVVINHMVPFSDRLESNEVISKVKRLLRDIPMVCNSNQAREQWGWGHTIIHGMEVDDWWNLPKEPRILTVLSGGGMEKAYRRKLLTDTINILENDYGETINWIGGGTPSRNSFSDYRDYLGRTLIYFQPTWNSPMPRSRTEAMLSGACIVSTKHQDWSSYITNGENGFLIDDNPKEAAALLARLVKDYNEAYEIGQRGRKFARDTFNRDSFETQWVEFLESLNIL